MRENEWESSISRNPDSFWARLQSQGTHETKVHFAVEVCPGLRLNPE